MGLTRESFLNGSNIRGINKAIARRKYQFSLRVHHIIVFIAGLHTRQSIYIWHVSLAKIRHYIVQFSAHDKQTNRN